MGLTTVRLGTAPSTLVFDFTLSSSQCVGGSRSNPCPSVVRKISSFLALLSIVQPLTAQIDDPIPAPISFGGLTVEVEDWLIAPATASGSPRARLSVMKPAYDGSGRIFINDLNGPLHVIRDGSLSTYLDLAEELSAFVDEPRLGTGFHSFAFHPEFAANGRFYTAHTEAAGAGVADFGSPIGETPVVQSVILEWTANDPAADVFSGTRRELLRIDYPRFVHNIQDIAFNPFVDATSPDYGMLYLCIGDGEAVNGGAPESGHRLDSLYGTLVRIDPLGTNGVNGRYGVPADNPFAGDGDAGTLAEIYAWGFRNPHRLCWDSAHPERLFLMDIGEKNAEEINLIVAGGDYGYSEREGTFVLNPAVATDEVFPLPANDSEFGYRYPVAWYDHDEGRAIAGGMVYRGTAVPQLQGKLVFGDIVNGRVFYVEADSLQLGSQAEIKELELTRNGTPRTLLSRVGGSRTDLRFGTDEAGELYLTTKQDGRIRRVTAGVEPPPVLGTGQLINISTRGQVLTGEGIMTGGFVITEQSRRVLIRGVGPGLAGLGVANTLADPVIRIFRSGSDDVVAQNDNWDDDAEIAAVADEVGAFALTTGSTDAALLVTLDPGVYTVQLSGAAGGTGVALVEVYQVAP